MFNGRPANASHSRPFQILQKGETYLDEEVFDDTIEKRREEADDFYYRISPLPMSEDLRNIQRQYVFLSLFFPSQQFLLSCARDSLYNEPKF